jgi:hypothetical protein
MNLLNEMAKKIFNNRTVLSKGEFRQLSAINFRMSDKMSNSLFIEFKRNNLIDTYGKGNDKVSLKLPPLFLNRTDTKNKLQILR